MELRKHRRLLQREGPPQIPVRAQRRPYPPGPALRRQPKVTILRRRNGSTRVQRSSRRDKLSLRRSCGGQAGGVPGRAATGTVISPDICSKQITSSASRHPRCRQSNTARQTSPRSLARARLRVQQPVAFQYNDVPVLRIKTCIIQRCQTVTANSVHSSQSAK